MPAKPCCSASPQEISAPLQVLKIGDLRITVFLRRHSPRSALNPKASCADFLRVLAMPPAICLHEASPARRLRDVAREIELP
jgi:hypothetical protein